MAGLCNTVLCVMGGARDAVLGTLTGLAALLNAVRFNQIPSNLGIGLEMKVIAAVVVGGASVAGGTGEYTMFGLVSWFALGVFAVSKIESVQ